MKRSSELRRKTPLRSVSAKKRKPQKARRKVQKDTRWRSDEYIAWIKRQPCVFCNQPADDPHHAIGLGWGLSGMGLTAPDSYAIPLCRPHHNLVHKDPAIQRLQPEWLIWTLKHGLEQYTDGPIHEALLSAREFVNAKREAA